MQTLSKVPGQTHLNLSENIRRIFNFTLPYAQYGSVKECS